MAAMLVYTTKECNYNSIVIVHRHGGYDVPGRGEGGGYSHILTIRVCATVLCTGPGTVLKPFYQEQGIENTTF